MDGSQKLPQRILGTISDNLKAGRASAGLMLAVAAWMRYLGGTGERGLSIKLKDPLSERFRSLPSAGETPAEKIAGRLGVREIFSAGLTAQPAGQVRRSYEVLSRGGARQVVEEML